MAASTESSACPQAAPTVNVAAAAMHAARAGESRPRNFMLGSSGGLREARISEPRVHRDLLYRDLLDAGDALNGGLEHVRNLQPALLAIVAQVHEHRVVTSVELARTAF